MRKEFIRTAPESVGLRSRDILRFIDLLEHSNTEMHGLMIMRHGQVCAEGWWAPFAPGLRHGLQSHTKTYAATAVGIAYTEGILGLDERLIDIFPEEAPAHPSENLKQLKVRDVLCMGCGMDTQPEDSEHWISDFLHTPVNHIPGTTYMYNSVGSTILGAIVRKKSGEGLHEYLTKRLFNKIGIDADNIRWHCMADGMEIGGGGMYATTEDNLRLMKLYADGGVWDGERILAADYVQLATSNQNDSASEAKNNPDATDNFLGYGYQIWMCKPKGVYRADGAMGQFTIVDPRHDMIIAINETAVGAHWAQSTLDIVWDYLDMIDSAPVEEDDDAQRVLQTKLHSLCLPHPLYRPESSTREIVNGKKYVISEGTLNLNVFSFFQREKAKKTEFFTLEFDPYGAKLVTGTSEKTETIRIATNGGRAENIMGDDSACARMLLCDGAWINDNTFEMHARWVETCFVRTIRFSFAGEKVTIDQTMNGMNPKGPFAAEPVLAVMEEYCEKAEAKNGKAF